MKTKFLLSGLLTLAIISCSTPMMNTSQDFTDIEKEYKSFSTKALSDAYVKRMFAKYLAPVNSVQLSRQLEFSRYLKNNGDISYETSLKSMFTQTPSLYDTLTLDSAIQNKISSESATFGHFVATLSPYNYTSCKALKTSGISLNGVYSIDQDNNFSTPKINVYCDMTTEGGGWTLVAAQYESDSVNWNEGIKSDYEPSLSTNKGFALNTSQLPLDRTQTGFGKDLSPIGTDYVNFVYSTGNIPVTEKISPKTGILYQIHRSSSGYYYGHDPEETWVLTTLRANTLTFDIKETQQYELSWAFSLNYSNPNGRGYSYNGNYYETTSETFAWTVWVR